MTPPHGLERVRVLTLCLRASGDSFCTHTGSTCATFRYVLTLLAISLLISAASYDIVTQGFLQEPVVILNCYTMCC